MPLPQFVGAIPHGRPGGQAQGHAPTPDYCVRELYTEAAPVAKCYIAIFANRPPALGSNQRRPVFRTADRRC